MLVPEALMQTELDLSKWGTEREQLDLAYRRSSHCKKIMGAISRSDWNAECQALFLTHAAQLGLTEQVLAASGASFNTRRAQSQSPSAQAGNALDPYRAGTNLGYLLLGLSDVPPAPFEQLRTALEPSLNSPTAPADARAAFLRSSLKRLPPDQATLTLAEALFREAIPHWAAGEDWNSWVNDVQNLARALLRQQQPDEARNYLLEVSARLNTTPAIRTKLKADQEHLLLSLALAEKHASTARAHLSALETLNTQVEGSSSSRWKLQLLRGQLAALEGDRHTARSHFQQAATELSAVSANAERLGFGAGFLTTHRQVADALLDVPPTTDQTDLHGWLKDYSLANSVQCRPEAITDLGLEHENTRLLAYLATEEQLYQFELSGRQLALSQKGPAWYSTLQALKDARYSAWLEAMSCQERSSPEALSPDLLEALLPDDAEVWILASLPDRVQGVRLRHSGASPLEVKLARQQLFDARRNIQERSWNTRHTSEVNDTLGHLSRLIPPDLPARGRLVVVLDPVLDGLPLDQLPLRDGVLLDHLSAFSQARTLAQLIDDLKSPSPTPFHRPVAIADSLPNIRKLPEALLSLKALQNLAPRLRTLQGSEARLTTVQAAANGATLLHLGVHGESQPLDPPSGRLELADGPLTVPILQRFSLDHALVFLSACESGPGGASGATIALAAHAAGARTVIAGRWKLEDRRSGQIERAFYQRLQRGASYAEALTAAIQAVYAEEPDAGLLRSALWLLGDPGWRRGSHVPK